VQNTNACPARSTVVRCRDSALRARDQFWTFIELARAKNAAEPAQGLRLELSLLNTDQLEAELSVRQ
jgi:hypothetical protein